MSPAGTDAGAGRQLHGSAAAAAYDVIEVRDLAGLPGGALALLAVASGGELTELSLFPSAAAAERAAGGAAERHPDRVPAWRPADAAARAARDAGTGSAAPRGPQDGAGADDPPRRGEDRPRHTLTRAPHAPETPPLPEVRRQLAEYFAGRRREFDLPLAPHGTGFERRVWQELCAIPYGETRSYADVARASGRPIAFRAVGRANGHNPIAIVIPCHRVIGADGSLTGYGGGLELKRFLLDLEGAPLRRGAGRRRAARAPKAQLALPL